MMHYKAGTTFGVLVVSLERFVTELYMSFRPTGSALASVRLDMDKSFDIEGISSMR